MCVIQIVIQFPVFILNSKVVVSYLFFLFVRTYFLLLYEALKFGNKIICKLYQILNQTSSNTGTATGGKTTKTWALPGICEIAHVAAAAAARR